MLQISLCEMENYELQFKFNEDQVSLLCAFTKEKAECLNVDENWIVGQIKTKGYGDLEVEEKGVTKLVAKLNAAVATSEPICIAKKKDAKLQLFISRDKMSGYLTITPARGGKPISLDMVKKGLANKGIRYGFIISAIKAAIVSGKANELLIATSEPAINGKDTQFICMLPEIKIRTPKVSENGSVDYRDLGEITIAHEGQALMRRTSATTGKSSKNIFGEIVNPRPGKGISFAAGLTGVKPSLEDPNILVATETGQPVIVESGVNVEKTMSVAQVNLRSGNVVFDGSVLIEGDIEFGMKVNATGDIHVKGLVEGATLDAGGDIIIEGAVIGRGDVRDPNGNLNKATAKLTAKGSISAKFIENGCLTANDSIHIQDWAIKSELDAYNEIIVGKKNAKKGQIIGGTAKSGILIKAMNIGSQAGVPTYVKVGNIVTAKDQADKLKKELSDLTTAVKQLHKILAGLRSNPTKQAKEAHVKVLMSKNRKEDELRKLRLQHELAKRDKKRAENACIIVEKAIYASATVSVAVLEKKIMEDLGPRTFVARGGRIVQLSE